MSQQVVQFQHGEVWMSMPPGVTVLATHEAMTVSVGAEAVLQMAVRRPDAMVLLDQVHVMIATPQGPATTVMTPDQARQWGSGFELPLDQGPLAIGELVTRAFEAHTRKAAAHRQKAASTLVTPTTAMHG